MSYKPLNIALAALSAVFLAWSLKILLEPFALPESGAIGKKRPKGYKAEIVPALSFYRSIDEKNIFSPAHGNEERAVKKATFTKPKEVLPPPPPPPKPVPKLSLVGTVLLGSGGKAILSQEGRKPSSYRIGEDIEGFVIKKIQSEKVLLEREGEFLEVTMKGSSSLTPAQSFQPLITPTLPGLGTARQGTSAGFVPPPPR